MDDETLALCEKIAKEVLRENVKLHDDDKELLEKANEFLDITRPTSLAMREIILGQGVLASEISLVYKMKTRLEELLEEKNDVSTEATKA